MPKTRGVVVGALLAALILVGGVESAAAATLRAEYRFQGDLASEVAGAPELVEIGQGNSFAFEHVDGLGLQQVLRFPKGNGLSLATAGLVNPTNNSVVVVFRLDDTDGYRRILDLTGGTSDNGLYNLNGQVVLYGGSGGNDASQNVLLDHSYAQVALTNAAALGGSEQATAYVNGAEVATAQIPKGFDLGSGVLRLFRDNTSGPAPGEESGGAVSCILIYDGTMTAGEVNQVAGDPTLCQAPRPTPGRAKASVTGKPKAIRARRSIVVDTGLTVSCPIGATPCAANGHVEAAPPHGPGIASKSNRLGVVRFKVPGGENRRVLVRLSGQGARALRNTGALRVKASAEIKAPQGRTARAQQTGRIKAPQPPAFRTGIYTGTTSQSLPIFVVASRTAVRSVFFRWRGICSDGKAHTSTILLRGKALVHRGHFSLERQLDTGGSARVTGKLKGARASGTLFRTGASGSDIRCAVKKIRWHARTSGIETETSD
jgi:concanavalin A-like lectin/glucanase superfamily protein